MGYEILKEKVLKANKELVFRGLVTCTWGNASEIDREKGVVAIKPSGVDYEKMSVNDIVVTDIDGNVVEGDLNPSSDLKTHLELYKSFPGIGGVVHTHSTFATGWAQAGEDLKCYGTTHADYFYGDVPVTRALTQEETADYEKNTGKVIAELFEKGYRDYLATPAALVKGHAPFTWGENAMKAVENAFVLEEVAKMAFITRSVTKSAFGLEQHIMDKHYYRKHGKNAYYGQKTKK